MSEKNFLSLFSVKKPVIAVLHGMEGSDAQVMCKTKGELELYREAGIDGVLVENYFCTPLQAEMVLEYVAGCRGSMGFGINLLGNDEENFRLAAKYDCDFMQMDSVCGHLPPEKDAAFAEFLQNRRASCRAKLIGGVRFKYQPYLSGRTLEEDLHLGVERCDALAVTGAGTGEETELGKIREFHSIIGDFPLIVAAGLTPENASEQMAIGDACIVGSYLKQDHQVENPVSADNLRCFMEAIWECRKAADGK